MHPDELSLVEQLVRVLQQLIVVFEVQPILRGYRWQRHREDSARLSGWAVPSRIDLPAWLPVITY